jgi:predicted site-specific integrase-resolvase
MSGDDLKLLNTAEAATYLRMATQTLAKWRSQGRGPYFVRIGGNVFYRVVELSQYIAANVTPPEKK